MTATDNAAPRPPTRRQLQVLDEHCHLHERNRWGPTLKQVAARLGLSVPSVWAHMRGLEGRGLVSQHSPGTSYYATPAGWAVYFNRRTEDK